MENLQLTIHGKKAELNILGNPSARELSALLEKITTSVEVMTITLPASAAFYYMLIQTLSFLRKQKIELTLHWSDHEPGRHLKLIIDDLIR